MENKLTAIEWFAEQLFGKGFKDCHGGIIEQAKEMEKEQIIDAHLTGLIRPLEIEATKQAEQYYNETYGKETERS